MKPTGELSGPDPARGAGRETAQRGSALILMPAAVLVLLVLGVIALDSAIEYLGHRQLTDFTSEAADDAASKALDQAAFYGGAGQLRIDASTADQVVETLRTTASTGGMTITSVNVVVSPDGASVTVSAVGEVRDVFGPAVSAHRSAIVRASSTATLHEVRGA